MSIWRDWRARSVLARIIFGISQVAPGTSYSKIEEAISRAGGPTIGHQSIRTFALRQTDSLANEAHLDALASYAKDRLVEEDQSKKLIIAEALKQADIFATISKRETFGAEEEGSPFISGAGLEEFYVLLQTYTKLDDKSHEDVASVFTRASKRLPRMSENEDRGFYLCYRYSSRAGFIAKSFFVVFPPDARSPFCTFKNFYKGRLEKGRNAEGIVLKLGAAVYFVGIVGTGRALKILALPRVSSSAQLHTGLLMSLDQADQPVCARAVLEPTGIMHSNGAKVGVFPEKNIYDDAPCLRPLLRNEIAFALNEEVFTRDGMRIDQSHLVSLVHTALHDGAEPVLTDRTGRFFNPAAHDRYPFNSALKAFTD